MELTERNYSFRNMNSHSVSLKNAENKMLLIVCFIMLLDTVRFTMAYSNIESQLIRNQPQNTALFQNSIDAKHDNAQTNFRTPGNMRNYMFSIYGLPRKGRSEGSEYEEKTKQSYRKKLNPEALRKVLKSMSGIMNKRAVFEYDSDIND